MKKKPTNLGVGVGINFSFFAFFLIFLEFFFFFKQNLLDNKFTTFNDLFFLLCQHSYLFI